MPINGATVLVGATGATTTGGTSITLSSDGHEIKNGVRIVDAAETNFLEQLQMTLKARHPQKQSDGSYSKAKRWATIVKPYQIASGDYVFNLARIETEIHHETPEADAMSIYMLGAQFFYDADFGLFLKSGSLL